MADRQIAALQAQLNEVKTAVAELTKTIGVIMEAVQESLEDEAKAEAQAD